MAYIEFCHETLHIFFYYGLGLNQSMLSSKQKRHLLKFWPNSVPLYLEKTSQAASAAATAFAVSINVFFIFCNYL